VRGEHPIDAEGVDPAVLRQRMMLTFVPGLPDQPAGCALLTPRPDPVHRLERQSAEPSD